MSSSNSRLLEALEYNWQAEMTGYHTYAALANVETDLARKRSFANLAQAEARHAALWASRLSQLGVMEPVYRGKPNGNADSLKYRLGGPDVALRQLEIDESRDIAKYGRQLKELGDESSVAILRQVIDDEKDHYRTLSALVRRGRSGLSSTDAETMLSELLAKRDKGHVRTAGWVGDAIYGINDGLGAIFGIVSGVSGATLGNSKWVLLAGLSGMIASALSMGSGAYLAAKSEREIYQAEIAREREAVDLNGAEARELLSLYYQVKGLNAGDADHVAEELAKNPEQMVKALTIERLNSTEDALRTPWTAAFSGAISTALGALIPVIPFFFLTGYTAVIVSAAISLAAHFAVGAAKSIITVRSWWSSGFEMTAVGAVEGIVTYVIGLGLGRLGS